MTAAIQQSLRQIDAAEIRSDLGSMRSALVNVTRSGSDVWTSSWTDVVAGLCAVGSVDQCLGRLVEGHADAMRILDQANAIPLPGIYGVWASRSAGTGLSAVCTDSRWSVSGELRFASGVDLIDRVLAPGWVDERNHLLFDLAVSDFEADRTGWPTAAMDASRSFSCRCDNLPGGEPVGPSNFYLDRPGFAIGGLGPAAVWAGGARLVSDQVTAAMQRFTVTSHQRRRLGVMQHQVWLANAVVGHTARALTSDDPIGSADQIPHVRTAVVNACDVVLSEAALIVGPAGLTQNTGLVRAMHDLSLYIRQHHLDATYEQIGSAAERVGAA